MTVHHIKLPPPPPEPAVDVRAPMDVNVWHDLLDNAERIVEVTDPVTGHPAVALILGSYLTPAAAWDETFTYAERLDIALAELNAADNLVRAHMTGVK